MTLTRTIVRSTTSSPSTSTADPSLATIQSSNPLITSTSASSPSAQGNKGQSAGASAAIGASIGGVASVLAFVLAFILIRRRKKGSENSKATAELPTVPLQPKEFPAEQVSSRHLSADVPAYSAD